jgi:hypothetical protein
VRVRLRAAAAASTTLCTSAPATTDKMQLLKVVYGAPTKWAPPLPERVPVGTHLCRSVFGTRGSVLLHHRWRLTDQMVVPRR